MRRRMVVAKTQMDQQQQQRIIADEKLQHEVDYSNFPYCIFEKLLLEYIEEITI